MPRKKSTEIKTTEKGPDEKIVNDMGKLYDKAIVDTTANTIEDSLDESTENASENSIVKHYIPEYDYRVVPITEVTAYLYKGYSLVGGPVVRFNDLYQGIILYSSKEASDEEYEAWEKTQK